MYILDRRGGNDGGSKKYSLGGSILPNKQKPVKNTRLFGVFHTSDLSIFRDNSCVVKVNVNQFGSMTEFLHGENLSLFHEMNTGFLHEKIIFLPST